MEKTNNTEVWSLTTEGHLKLNRNHPELEIVLQDLVKSVPILVVIISSILGFLGAVAALIMFFDYLRH